MPLLRRGSRVVREACCRSPKGRRDPALTSIAEAPTQDPAGSPRWGFCLKEQEMASNKPRVFIDGESGTTGLGIRARLEALPEIALKSLPPALRRDRAARRDVMAEVELVKIGRASCRERV